MDQRIVTVILGLLTFCSTPSCQSSEPRTSSGAVTYANTGNLAAAMHEVESVSFHPTARVVEPIPGRSIKALRFTTEKAIEEVFSSRGYRFVPAGQGEREIAYAIGVSGELSDQELQRVFGISAGIGETPEEQRGGMVMAIVNPRIRSVLWRFGGSGTSNQESAQRENAVRVQSAVQEFLSELPPRQR